jgi:hypothetical protein
LAELTKRRKTLAAKASAEELLYVDQNFVPDSQD